MALTDTPVCEFGAVAPDFHLLATDGQRYSFDDLAGPKGSLIMFICNHCPYVIAIQDRLVSTANQLRELGVGVAAINANDGERYPADNFDNMVRIAGELSYPFPYLHDPTQQVARAYGAVCTPDFFGYNSRRELQYRGRLDATTPGNPAPAGAPNELFEAMRRIASDGQGPDQQTPSMGCSIKWLP